MSLLLTCALAVIFAAGCVSQPTQPITPQPQKSKVDRLDGGLTIDVATPIDTREAFMGILATGRPVYYSVSAKRGDILRFKGKSAQDDTPANIAILDEEENVLHSSMLGPKGDMFEITRTGTYFIKVFPSWGRELSLAYSLRVSSKRYNTIGPRVDLRTYGGLSADEATEFTPGEQLQGLLTTESKRYFKTHLTEGTILLLAASGAPRIELQAPNGDVLEFSTRKKRSIFEARTTQDVTLVVSPPVASSSIFALTTESSPYGRITGPEADVCPGGLSPQTATPIKPGQSCRGFLTAGSERYFSVILATVHDLEIRFGSQELKPRVDLLDEHGTSLVSDGESPIKLSAPPTSLLIKVTKASFTSFGSFRLSIK